MFCTESGRPSAIFHLVNILSGTRRRTSAANGDCVLRLGPLRIIVIAVVLHALEAFLLRLFLVFYPGKTSNFRTFLNLIADITNYWTLSVTLDKTSCCDLTQLLMYNLY